MEFRLKEADLRIAAGLQRLQDIKALIDARDGADPVPRGADISVYEIEALTRGQTAQEIIEDHPGLARKQIEAAVEYAKIYPRTGRPSPARSFKQALVDMAKAGAWDVESEKMVEPHTIP
jgi:uncharacterized protein (DUF433 family)